MTQSNIELMNKIRGELLEKSSISKGMKDDIRSNIINYFKTMVMQEFNFEGINLFYILTSAILIASLKMEGVS